MNRPLDTAKHKGQRKLLIDKLAAMGIKDPKVLEAMLQVPRHWFMDSGLESHAYDNKAFPIASDQTISHPYTVHPFLRSRGFQGATTEKSSIDPNPINVSVFRSSIL